MTKGVTALYLSSRSGEEFEAKLRDYGYTLVKGDRRDFCILDSAGHKHSLARRLRGVNATALSAFMQGVQPEA
jgi:hypothetical protein